VLPLAAYAYAARRAAVLRALLRLPAPPALSTASRRAALVAAPLLLGIAAMQPALVSATSLPQRTDAEAFFVVDTSRSMLAADGPDGRTRIERARDEARSLRDEIAAVPSGLAGVSDRVLPYIFPTADRFSFQRTLQRAVGIDRPPPASVDVVSTSLQTLGDLVGGNFFAPDLRHRLVVVLTDGESQPVDAFRLQRLLVMGPRLDVVVVRLWQPGEAIYRPDGTIESSYHPDPSSAQLVQTVATAFGGAAFDESQGGAIVQRLRSDLGQGPVVRRGEARRTTALAPYLVLLALLPLAYLTAPTALRRLRSR
jgi:hypothetical protein